MIIAGIDPGLSGAVAAVAGSVVDVVDMPVHQLQRGGKAKRELDAHGSACWRLSRSRSRWYRRSLGKRRSAYPQQKTALVLVHRSLCRQQPIIGRSSGTTGGLRRR